jgi:hypothetical protein
MKNEQKIKELEIKIDDLRSELDLKDNNPIESNRLRREIQLLVKELEKEKGKRIVSPDSAKDYFDQMRKNLELESINYKNFFDL